MAFLIPQLQIISDLHLETPISRPQYASFNLDVTGTALFLLGDIGLVKDDGLFNFLRRTLDQNRGCRIFYVLGNHESYQVTLDRAVADLRTFEKEAKENYGGRFHFLFRDRYDLDDKITILGCTLWSNLQAEQITEISRRMTDFNEERGIQDWTPERSCQEHLRDLQWLNKQVRQIKENEPTREIVIATHHCPTMDPRATAPAHRGSTMSSAFGSDLSQDLCWTAPVVKCWAFGHTHYTCAFHDEKTQKLIVSNQKGNVGVSGGSGRRNKVKTVIVEPREPEWRMRKDIEVVKSSEEQNEDSTAELSNPTLREDPTTATMTATQQKPSLLQRAIKKVQAHMRLPSRSTI